MSDAGRPGQDQTVDFGLDDRELDAGLHAAFAGDTGSPLPAGGSVLRALEATAPGSVRRVQMRPPDGDPPTPVKLTASEELPPPQSFPQRYQLVGEIARGGMGAVFLGRDTDLGRDIAVKMILETHKDRSEMLQRFVEEAQIGGQLQHPGILPVYELGQSPDRRPYFTMKLVKGQTLAALLHQRHNPQHELPRFLGIFEQVCQTVAYAHARGVIHRDLKPANVMVGSFGEVQVMDWGLAKVLARRGAKPSSEEASAIRTVRCDEQRSSRQEPASRPGSQTAVGSILGTPAYMAPEQARGEVDTLDERCDVFGLGAILCQVLTGKPPYAGTNRPAADQHARRTELDAALARLDGSGADAELIALAKRCLAADKEDRPRDAGEVARAVTAYQESVQARLKQAELERAAAQARADEEQRRRQAEQARAAAEQARADEEQRRRQAEQARAAAEQARADEEQRRRQAEQARAQTERQRRRLTLALAAVVLLLVAGAGAAGWWYQQDRLEQAHNKAMLDAQEAARQAEAAIRKEYLHNEVAAALQGAEENLKDLQQALQTLPSEEGPALTVAQLLSDLKQWESRVQSARAHWQQARKLADSSPGLLQPEQKARLQQLEALVTAAEADYQVAHQLDNIRLEASTLVDGKCNVAQAGPKYEALFLNTLKLDLRNGRLPALAAHFKGSALRYVLVAALDDWADVTADKELLPRLLEVARLADPEPWRGEVRSAMAWQDVAQLKKSARDVKPRQQLPQTLILLAHRLFDTGAQQTASALLRTALLHHPADFWLNVHLGELANDPGEKVGCFRAALAIRPGTLSAYNNLGAALYDMKDLGGAIQAFQQAIVLDPRTASLHYNMGYILYAKRDLDGAIHEYNKAIALDPRNAPTHYNLGLALKDKGDLEGAIQAWQKAIELDPNHALSHNNLGLALASRGDLDGAIKECHQAVVLDPKCGFFHFNLGNVLRARGDLEGAIKEYEQAVELDPRDAHAHNSLGNVLADRGDLEGAIRAYHKAIELGPRDALPHYNLGQALKARGDLEAAIACYKKALQLDRKIPQAHYSLGHALLPLGRFAEAREATAQALQLLSPVHPLHKTAQKQLVQCEQLLALDQKLSMVLSGRAHPGNAGDQLILAHLCRMYKQQYAVAARFYAAAFAAAPELVGDLTKPRRYNAACAAALAAAGRGKDAGKLDAPARAKLRQQALAWLEADLVLWQHQATGDAAARQALIKALSHWQTDPDLASVRGDQALAQLPESERKDWQALWADVAGLLKQASK